MTIVNLRKGSPEFNAGYLQGFNAGLEHVASMQMILMRHLYAAKVPYEAHEGSSELPEDDRNPPLR